MSGFSPGLCNRTTGSCFTVSNKPGGQGAGAGEVSPDLVKAVLEEDRPFPLPLPLLLGVTKAKAKADDLEGFDLEMAETGSVGRELT